MEEIDVSAIHLQVIGRGGGGVNSWVFWGGGYRRDLEPLQIYCLDRKNEFPYWRVNHLSRDKNDQSQ